MRFWYHFFGFKEGWEFLSCYCVGFSGALGLFVKVIQGGFSRSDQGSVRQKERDERERRKGSKRERERERITNNFWFVEGQIFLYEPNGLVLKCLELSSYYHKPQSRFMKFTLKEFVMSLKIVPPIIILLDTGVNKLMEVNRGTISVYFGTTYLAFF